MASMFPQTLNGQAVQQGVPEQQQPPAWVNPYDAIIAQQRAALMQQQAPMYTPEQVQQRRQQNEREYALGVLGQLSGDQALGGVGAQVFKQALAGRTPKVSERGTSDPLTGEFKYSPEYLRERDEASVQGLEQRRAQAEAMQFEREQARQYQLQERERQREFMAAQNAANRAARGGNEPMVKVIGEDGEPMYVPRSQAAGMRAPVGAGNVTEGERNSAGFASRMIQSTKLLDTFEEKGTPTATTQTLGAVPMVGGFLRRGAMSPAQQQYDQAAQDWIRAKLRKESGASIPPDEMAQEYAAYFPLPNDGPAVIAQKRQAREVATQAMLAAAGRGMAAIEKLQQPAVVDVGAALKRPTTPQALPKSNPRGANRVVEADW